MRIPEVARSDRDTRNWRAASVGAALVLFTTLVPVGGVASTRDELDQLTAKMAQVQERLTRLEAQQASLQKDLLEISERLAALSRAAQTADIRADLDTLKGRVEALANRAAPAPDASPQPSPPASPTPPPTPPPEAASVPPASAKPPKAVPGSSGEDLYSQAHRDYLGGRYDLAASQFLQFLEAYPSDPKAPNAQYWAGECLYSQKRFPEAVEAFQAVLKKFPGSAKERAAELKVGLCHLAEGDTRKGRQILEALVKEDPEGDEAEIARERLERLPPP